MKKWLITLLLLFTSSCLPLTIHAGEPFPPFSVEGNPDDAYQFSEIFPLFRYITPQFFQIYENEELTRNYEDYEVCKSADHDRRDYACSFVNGVETDGCDGGEVDICFVGGGTAYTERSGKTGCKPPIARDQMVPGTVYEGKCEYTQTPRLTRKIKGTDFSKENRDSSLNASVSSPSPEASPTNPFSGLSYPKLQTEQGFYENIGGDNSLNWGTGYLGLDLCTQNIRRLLVLTRASQTKETLSSTGEWPLGWVDWGYQTVTGDTLLELYQSLPGELKSIGKIVVESQDDFFLTSGNIEQVSNVGPQLTSACQIFADAGGANPPEWYEKFLTSPIYPPSFRQGFVRGSICVWNACCPGGRCPVPREELEGVARALYYDISISRAFNGAIDELMYTYPLKEAKRILTELASVNPLIQFAGSAAPQAIPSRIKARLENELSSEPCFKYHHIMRWAAFGGMVDYLKPNTFLDPEKKCPNYKILSGQSKEEAGAFPDSTLQKIIDLLWSTFGGQKLDEVIPVFKHLITIPDAMGQSIAAISQGVYNTRDTLSELEKVQDFNSNLSNVVDDQADLLYAGKPPYDPRRRLAYFTCADPYFSAQTKTGIEAYALGTRIGCSQDTLAEGVCDGQTFTKLLQNAGGVPTTPSAKASQYFASNIQPKLTPELMKTYALAEQATGVPCEILAGIHFIEADNNPDGSLVSGRRIGTPEPDAGGKTFKTLQETADYAGNHLLGKVGGELKDVPTAITALSRYNGGGNSNCQLGYPYPIPYGNCPRDFEGEDDPYPANWLDARHETMYLLYCADHTACEPQVFERPGSFTVALAVYENMTKTGNAVFADANPIPPPSPTTSAPPLPIFAPKNCDPESLDTALGCLPYDERLTGTLLGFVAGIAGAISLVVMLMGTIQIMTAGADPEKLKKGKELFNGAVIGLLFVIFSVTLLRIIAGDIIKLPGFQAP